MSSMRNGPESASVVPKTPVVADSVLLAAVDVARNALLETTPADSVGSVIGSVAEDEHVLSLQFECTLAGYPGWHWTATLARVDDNAPTVLEIELLPGEDAVVAPDWVPWSDRLAEQHANQELADSDARAGAEHDDDNDNDDNDDNDDDDDDGDDNDDDDDDDIDETDLVDDELDDALDHLDEDDIVED